MKKKLETLKNLGKPWEKTLGKSDDFSYDSQADERRGPCGTRTKSRATTDIATCADSTLTNSLISTSSENFCMTFLRIVSYRGEQFIRKKNTEPAED